MHFQQRFLKQNATFTGTSGLETIELPNKGLLSGLQLRTVLMTGAFTGACDMWTHDWIKKIELIVNGSQVVVSLTGEQVLALMHYKNIEKTNWEELNLNADYQREHFYIPLGRYYHDMDYMLDLGKVNDPELRIEYDFTQTSKHGWANGFAAGTDPTPSYSLTPHLLRESDIVPKGYIKTSEIYRYQSANSKQENMIVPRGPLYANLYVQSWYQGKGFEDTCDMLELNFDSDNVIPFRQTAQALMSDLIRQYGYYEGSIVIEPVGNQNHPIPIEAGVVEGQMETAGDYDVKHAFCGNNGFWVKTVVHSTGAGTVDVTEVALKYKGVGPYSVFAIPTFDLMDERTWVDSRNLGDLWVRGEGTAACGANNIVKLLADEVVKQ